MRQKRAWFSPPINGTHLGSKRPARSWESAFKRSKHSTSLSHDTSSVDSTVRSIQRYSPEGVERVWPLVTQGELKAETQS